MLFNPTLASFSAEAFADGRCADDLTAITAGEVQLLIAMGISICSRVIALLCAKSRVWQLNGVYKILQTS